MIKSIHPELRCIFLNSSNLCSPSPFTAASPVNRPPVPVVDWSKVNQRSLGNLPQPKIFPKLGCSNDPILYAPVIDDHGCVRVTHPSPHKKPFPFGGEFGLMTDLGVISTNKGDHMDDPYNNIIHGHVWSRELQETQEGRSGVPLMYIPSHCRLAQYCLSLIIFMILYAY